jgi:hypothetical protein
VKTNSPIKLKIMKTKLLHIATAITLALPGICSAQSTPTLGTAANFVMFSTNGAVSNTGISHLTGNIGTNNGSSTGFGNVDGTMNDANGISAQAATDLLSAYNQLNSAIATIFPAPLLGNGQVLTPGVHSIGASATLNLDLTFNALGNPSAVFIMKIQGALSTNASSKVKLINGAKACNVFWKVEGLVSMASGSSMKGTIIANNAAINMNTGDTLEGRALSTAGAVTSDGVFAYTPIGCGSPLLTGPASPTLGSVACYALFSGNGSLSNTGITKVIGDVGTNVGLTTGFSTLTVQGSVHPIPDGSTGQCASDLLTVYNTLNTMPYDIELLYPAQFGKNLVLTPHVYRLNGATTFIDTLYLNAENNTNAVFVLQMFGALSTGTYAKVILTNGAQPKNVYWLVNGGVNINNYSDFKGTIIANNGAVSLNMGATVVGRVLTTNGAFSTASNTITITSGTANIATQPSDQTACVGDLVSFNVVSTGPGLSYQWRKGTVNLVNGGNISGVTYPLLTINPMAAGDVASNYNVVVSGDCSASVTSTNVALILCSTTGIANSTITGGQVVLYPNPFTGNLVLNIKNVTEISNCNLIIYNVLGTEVVNIPVDTELTSISTTDLPKGLYFYKVLGNGKTIKSGKLISQN